MKRFNHKLYLGLALVFYGFITPALAHEYWIEPLQYEIAVGDVLKADLRNGQNYKGNQLYYLKHRFTKFEVHNADGIHQVSGSDGDQPALKFETKIPGLHILSYQSIFDTLTMEKWEKFLSYTKNQGLDHIPKRHIARGLPQAYINEEYARTIKALVRVGDGKGEDRRTGLPFEFVAQQNPFTMGADPESDEVLTVRLFLDEKWQANKQVLIFQHNGTITQSLTRTDAQGFAKVPLKGGGKFMLSAVHMFEGDDDPETKRPEWISYWANLTFALPGADKLLAIPPKSD